MLNCSCIIFISTFFLNIKFIPSITSSSESLLELDCSPCINYACSCFRSFSSSFWRKAIDFRSTACFCSFTLVAPISLNSILLIRLLLTGLITTGSGSGITIGFGLYDSISYQSLQTSFIPRMKHFALVMLISSTGMSLFRLGDILATLPCSLGTMYRLFIST